ncbi:hypothetical protein AKJ16_DCAP21931 [Drosera capensis]
MRIEKVQVGERGLVAVQSIRKGEKLLFVPPSLLITAEPKEHTFKNGEEECRCTFMLFVASRSKSWDS